MLSRIKEFVSRRNGCPDHLFASKILKIETSATCNVRCVWCWMYNSGKVKQGLMSLDNFKRLIDVNEKYLKRNGWLIEPFFNGEALMNPRFFDMMDYSVGRNLRFSPRFDTNLSVRVDINRLMSYPWNEIWVNVGGTTKGVHERVMRHSSFDLTTENLKKMLKINQDIVCIKMNPTRDNLHQFGELKSFFTALGGKERNIRPYTTSFPLPGAASLEEKRQFFENVVSEQVRPYLRFDYNLEKENFGIKARHPGCNFLVPSIAFDGRVAVCCHDQTGTFNMGNAFETPLNKIFNSKKYADTVAKCRKMEFDFCKECN